MITSKPVNGYIMADRLRGLENRPLTFSFKAMGMMVTFFFGFILYLIAFSTKEWFGIENGISASLWQQCSKSFKSGEWTCHYWKQTPDFVRAGQGFSIVSMILYLIAFLVTIIFIFIKPINIKEKRAALILLCLLIFSAGCMTLMAVIVIGVKSEDFCLDIKRDRWKMFEHFMAGIDVSGIYSVGWSCIIAILSSLITLVSFGFTMAEFIRVNEIALAED